MTYNELMIQSLSALLESNETLKFPIYGALIQGNKHWFGFWGLTDHYLLNALLIGNTKKVGWTSRIPLDIKAVKAKKSLIPFLYRVRIEFNEGLPCNLQASKKVIGFANQEANLSDFIDCLQKQTTSIDPST